MHYQTILAVLLSAEPEKQSQFTALCQSYDHVELVSSSVYVVRWPMELLRAQLIEAQIPFALKETESEDLAHLPEAQQTALAGLLERAKLPFETENHQQTQ